MKFRKRLSFSGRPPRVAILVDTSTDWSRRVINGIAQYIRAHDFWHLFVEPHGPDEYLELPQHWDGDGIIARITNEKMAQDLRALKIPVVNVSAIHLHAALEFPRVTTDVAATAQMAVKYFFERGFKNFAYLSLRGLEYAQRQQEAFIAAAHKAGCKCVAHGVKTHSGAQTPDWNLRIEHLSEWLLSLRKPVAVLTWSGGREVLHACHAAGLRVPEEVALLSGSNDFLCNVARVPISAIHPACERIGGEAAALLHQLMLGRKVPQDPILIPPLHIVTRQSTDTLAISDPAMVKALSFIRENIGKPINIGKLAPHAGISRRLLEQRFLSILGCSPGTYIRRVRLDRAKALLMETGLSIETVANACGFTAPEYMTLCFRKAMKTTPLKFRRRFSITPLP